MKSAFKKDIEGVLHKHMFERNDKQTRDLILSDCAEVMYKNG